MSSLGDAGDAFVLNLLFFAREIRFVRRVGKSSRKRPLRPHIQTMTKRRPFTREKFTLVVKQAAT